MIHCFESYMQATIGLAIGLADGRIIGYKSLSAIIPARHCKFSY